MPTLRAAIDAREAVEGGRQFTDSTNKMSNAAGRFVKGGDGMSRSMTNMGTVGGKLAGTMRTLAASVSAMLVMRDVINVNKQYEATMAELQGITNATAAQMGLLSDVAREMGSTTKFSASEAGEGLIFLARAGFGVDQAVSALPATLNLATAANMDLGRSADIASNILSTFRLRTEETSRVVDVLAKTSNSANTDVEQLAHAMKFVGPTAAALGISVEEASAAIGVLSDNGIQGALAGTNLRGILASLVKPTKMARTQLEQLGLSVSELNPESNSLESILRKLGDANLSVGQATRIFGREMAGSALILSNGTTRINELTEANNNAAGEAQRMADVMGRTLSGRLKGLRSALEEVFLQAGESGLVGTFKKLISWTTQLVRVIGGSSDAVDNANTGMKVLAGTVKLVSGFFQGLVRLADLVFSNIYVYVQEVSKEWGTGLFGTVSRFFDALVNGQITVQDLAVGFIGTVKKMGALFMAFLVEPVINAIDGIKKMWQGFTEFFEVAMNSPLAAVVQALATFANTTLGLIRDMIDGLASLASFISSDVANAIAEAGRSIGSLQGDIQEAADQIAGDAGPKAKAALAKIGEGASQAAALVIPTFDSMEARIESFGAKNEEINNWVRTQVEQRVQAEIEAEQRKQAEIKKLQTGSVDTTGDGEPDGGLPTPGGADEFASRLESLQQEFMTEQELLATQRDERMAFLHEARLAEALAEDEYQTLRAQVQKQYQDTLTQIERDAADKRSKVRQQEWQAGLTMAQQSLGAMQQLLIASGNKQLAESKAFGIAQAVISTAIGISRAMELGWPAAIPAMALAAATGAAQIAAITSASKGTSSAPSSSGTAGASSGGGTGGGAAPSSGPPASTGPSINIQIADLSDDEVYTGATVRRVIDRISDQVGDGAGSDSTAFGGRTMNQGALS